MKKILFGFLVVFFLVGCEGHVHVNDDHHPPPVHFDYPTCFDWAYSELIIHWGFPHYNEEIFYENRASDWCSCIQYHGEWYYDYYYGFFVFDPYDVCYFEVIHPWE